MAKPIESNLSQDGLEATQPMVDVAAAPAIGVNMLRRKFLMGRAVVGIGGVTVAAIRDGELGGPAQTIRGSIPWQQGSADVPPDAFGSGYVFFSPAEVSLINAVPPFERLESCLSSKPCT